MTVLNMKKDKLKDTTEIARLKGELQRNVSESQQLVLNLKKDKLKDTTEIAALKGCIEFIRGREFT